MTIEVPDALHDQIVKEADARGVAPKWLVTRMLTEAIGTLAPPENFSLIGGAPAKAEPGDGAAT